MDIGFIFNERFSKQDVGIYRKYEPILFIYEPILFILYRQTLQNLQNDISGDISFISANIIRCIQVYAKINNNKLTYHGSQVLFSCAFIFDLYILI